MSCRKCIKEVENFQKVSAVLEGDHASSQADFNKETISIFLSTLKKPYFDHMIGQVTTDFANSNYDRIINRGWHE